MQEKAILKLQELIKAKFPKPLDSVKNKQELANSINIGLNTLKRFYGEIDKDKKNSKSTLSQICIYVGYKDWDSFLKDLESEYKISDDDKSKIEHMDTFFKNGEKYNINYQQSTLTVDTLNEYIQTIFKNKETILYFYNLYQENNWVCDYVFAWLPNYNFISHKWFRDILQNHLNKTSSNLVKLTLSNHLFLGSYLALDTEKYDELLSNVKKYYTKYQKEYRYMPYHEMRYHSILLIDAKERKDTDEFNKILFKYLEDLENSGLDKLNKQELIVFLCNTLIWIQEYEFAYSILSENTDFFKHKEDLKPLHFYGVNTPFVKVTYELAWFTNKKPIPKIFELNDNDFSLTNGLLYNDYIHVMSLIYYIKKETKKKSIDFLKNELDEYIKKTNLNITKQLI